MHSGCRWDYLFRQRFTLKLIECLVNSVPRYIKSIMSTFYSCCRPISVTLLAHTIIRSHGLTVFVVVSSTQLNTSDLTTWSRRKPTSKSIKSKQLHPLFSKPKSKHLEKKNIKIVSGPSHEYIVLHTVSLCETRDSFSTVHSQRDIRLILILFPQNW